MKINFKKVATVLGSALMVGSTVAMAAAASFPAPFVSNGSANVAVVVGAQAALSDAVAATSIGSKLATELAAQTATGGSASSSVTGEAAALFTGSTKIYIGDNLNAVKSVLTKTELPTVLKDGSFSGNVDATYIQTLSIGSNPSVTFAKAPTSDDDPEYVLTTSTSTNNAIYNATVTFNKAVNMTHADSKGEEISLFGQTYTVASTTSSSNLVLLQSAESIGLSSDAPTAEVEIAGKKYTVELVSASDTSATVKVTDEAGNAATKEVNENNAKKVSGLTIAVVNADENNLKYSASIIAGSEKVTLVSGSSVTVGEDDTTVDGTKVTFTGGIDAMTKMVISVAAPNSDEDAVKPGKVFTDPVFKTFKLDFNSINVPADSTSREAFTIQNAGDDKMEFKMTPNRGDEKSITWAVNQSGAVNLQIDTDGRNITVVEGQNVYRNEYVMVGNEDEGYLLKLSQVTNQSTSYSSDKVVFADVYSGDSYTATITAEGSGTITIGGKVYDVTYSGSADTAEEARAVTLNYPDSTAGSLVLYPTIQSNKGALVAFYEPVSLNRTATGISTLKFPDGDGYTDVTLPANGTSQYSTVGRLNYSVSTANNVTSVALVNPDGGATITQPALVIFEEKDDNTNYEAMIVTLETNSVGDSNNGLGVSDVVRTWGSDASAYELTMASDSKKTVEADLFGSLITIDASDSDQKTVSISYPDEQVYAMIYVGEESANIALSTTSGSATELGSVTVYDNEAASVSGKNLIVVGGSCVNSVAAELLGVSAGALGCQDAFSAKTSVMAGEALIKSFDKSGKVALLVAGYNAADTTKAATYLVNTAVDTTVGKALKVTSATEATAITA